MSLTITPALSAIFVKLRAMILTIAPTGTEVVLGQQNRVPLPLGRVVVMTPLWQRRLATNQSEYDDPVSVIGSRAITASMELAVQLDTYGEGSGGVAAQLVILIRDDYGCEALAPDAAPFYVDDARQIPLVSGEQQYVERWTSTALFGYTPRVAVPQEFADQAIVDLISVDASYPP